MSSFCVLGACVSAYACDSRRKIDATYKHSNETHSVIYKATGVHATTLLLLVVCYSLSYSGSNHHPVEKSSNIKWQWQQSSLPRYAIWYVRCTLCAILKWNFFLPSCPRICREWESSKLRDFYFWQFIFLGNKMNCLQHFTQASVQCPLKKHFDALHFLSPAHDESNGIPKKRYSFFLFSLFISGRTKPMSITNTLRLLFV